MNLNSTFDKQTTSINYDVLQTFDNSTEEDEKVSTSFTAINADKYPAIAFTEALFEYKPELFGPYAMSLIYAQHSGTSYKPEVVYGLFEQYIKYGPRVIIETMKKRVIAPYEFTPNYLILWAKLLRNTRMTITFEPIMNILNKVLNEWFQNKKVIINGISYDITTFKSLCYTRSGECYFALLPYIVYLITFLIDCRPYAFNEAQTESSTFGFYTSLNTHCAKYYTAFKEDTGVDLTKTDPRNLPSTVSDKQLMDLLTSMLHPDKIIKLRNDEISKTPSLLDECIKDQTELSERYVHDAFSNTFNRCIKILIQQNPIKYIFDSIPRFKSDNSGVNIDELMNWTSYALAGGDKPFLIESYVHTTSKQLVRDYTNVLHSDPKSITPLPSIICDKQELKSRINPLMISKQLPFNENDVILNMCTAYVRNRYEIKKGDILDDDPINISEPMLWQENTFGKPLSVVLKNLFINGIWGYDNSNLSKVLDQLCNIPEFVSEVTDILSLANVTQLIYTNRLASAVISVYILSFLNVWILDTVARGLDLRLMRPYRYIVRASVDSGRVGKLCNMITALMMISSDKYVAFVNSVVKDFITIIEQEPVIQQPYIKRLADLADVYAIGGCELYRWASHNNPLVRGSMWYYNVFGWSEELEALYQWLVMLDNTALMELLETNLNDTSNIEATLKTQFLKMYEMRKYPLLLINYEFDAVLGYKEKKYPYAVAYKNSSDAGVVGLITKRAFKRSLASQSTTESIWFKRIMYKGGEVVARKAHKNQMDVNNKILPARISETGIPLTVPIYDIMGKLDDVKVLYTTPAGYRVIPLVLGNSRSPRNQTMLIYTNTAAKTRFSGGYDV